MKITVDLGDGQGIQLMETHLLDGPYYSIVDNEHEHTTVTQWRLGDKVVHRSVHVHLKQGLGIEALMGQMG